MKKIKIIVASIICFTALAAYAASSITYNTSTGQTFAAEVGKPAGSTDAGALRIMRRTVLLYDSGLVPSGGVINIPTLDTSMCSAVMTSAINSDASATRVLTLRYFLVDGTTQIGASAFTATAISSTGLYMIGPSVASSGVQGAVTVIPPLRLSGTWAAGGTSNGRITIFCQ